MKECSPVKITSPVLGDCDETNSERTQHGRTPAKIPDPPSRLATDTIGGVLGGIVSRVNGLDRHSTDRTLHGQDIVASFHTHPNTGVDFLQELSQTDIRSVRDDRDLKGSEFLGEIVLAKDKTYLITPMGSVEELGSTQAVLGK